jgi:hypothetical protein
MTVNDTSQNGQGVRDHAEAPQQQAVGAGDGPADAEAADHQAGDERADAEAADHQAGDERADAEAADHQAGDERADAEAAEQAGQADGSACQPRAADDVADPGEGAQPLPSVSQVTVFLAERRRLQGQHDSFV